MPAARAMEANAEEHFRSSVKGFTENLRLPAADDGIQAVIVGAGLSIACRSAMPDWRELVRRLHVRLRSSEGPVASLPPDFDPRPVAMDLSWRYGRRVRGPNESQFQGAIATILTQAQGCGSVTQDTDLSRAFVEFLDAAKITVVIDLNYDRTVEQILECEGIPYWRTIGSEGVVDAPFVDGRAKLLWKVHGSVDEPPTIVLSPTEYQRIYETNALGPQLQRLGKRLGMLWSVGAGLIDDDIWAYLCSGDSPSRVVALWMSNDEHESLRPWLSLVFGPKRETTVIAAPLPTADQGRMSDRLTSMANCLNFGIGPRPPQPSRAPTLARRLRHRCEEFEKRYSAALAARSTLATEALVSDYRGDYLALQDYLTSHSSSGAFGPRWFPKAITKKGTDAAELCGAIAYIIQLAMDLSGDHQVEDGRSLLVAAAVQATVVRCIELAELHGIDARTELTLPSTCFLAEGHTTFVGADPFFSSPDRINVMHRFTTEREITLRPPLLGHAEALPSESKALLKEDEWEAAVAHLFRSSQPILHLAAPDGGSWQVKLATTMVPPPFPWGFRFRDIVSFRKIDHTKLSKYWNLVDDFDDDYQICKGGGMRDVEPRSFRLGHRGRMRAGEYDEFVIRAPYANGATDT